MKCGEKRMKQSIEFNFAGTISVQTLDRNAGIFIGDYNHAVGWSAHGKANNVIGDVAGKSNFLYQNVLVLNDPDYIDTPIDDRDINLSVNNPGAEQTTNLTLDNLHVQSMLQNSVVAIGDSQVTGMDANEKVNHSFGSIYGNANNAIGNVNVNIDQDAIDATIDDRDIKIANVERE